MQTCITKYLGLRNTYVYLAYKLEVHMQVVCKYIVHIYVELCILVACPPTKSLPGGGKYWKNHKNFAPTLLAYFFSGNMMVHSEL